MHTDVWENTSSFPQLRGGAEAMYPDVSDDASCSPRGLWRLTPWPLWSPDWGCSDGYFTDKEAVCRTESSFCFTFENGWCFISSSSHWAHCVEHHTGYTGIVWHIYIHTYSLCSNFTLVNGREFLCFFSHDIQSFSFTTPLLYIIHVFNLRNISKELEGIDFN